MLIQRLFLCFGLFLICISCSKQESVIIPKSFDVIVEEVQEKTQFPAVQSFVLAQGSNPDQWLIFAGRTNGMHGFELDNYEGNSFPIRNFNDTIWVYNYAEDQRVGFPVNQIDGPGSLLFKATNLQHFQDGNSLYVSGGYGENDSIAVDDMLERYDTYSSMARIDVDGMIKSIVAGAKKDEVNQHIIYGSNEMVRATGGELYKLEDHFYLAGGHVYKGMFSVKQDGTITPTSQQYLNAIHRFKLDEVDGMLELTDASKITDGFADDSTQFRRRDLPVTPAVYFSEDGSWDEGFAMYAGVFTSPKNKIKTVETDDAWNWPIFVYKDGSYTIDSNLEQYTNIYSAPSFVAVDEPSRTVYTTIIGGIDTTNMAAYSNTVSTIEQTLNENRFVYNTIQQALIPGDHFFGAEAFMVLDDSNRLAGAKLDVFDISGLNPGDEINIGVFCGGIEAFIPNPSGFGPGKSQASNKIWRVKLRVK